MSDATSNANSTVATINLVFKLAELGAKFLESRQKRLDVTRADAIDTVDEALREFEELDIPKAYEPPDDRVIDVTPRFTKHELEEGEDVIASGEIDEVEGKPV